jgi:hypothetical protein
MLTAVKHESQTCTLGFSLAIFFRGYYLRFILSVDGFLEMSLILKLLEPHSHCVGHPIFVVLAIVDFFLFL